MASITGEKALDRKLSELKRRTANKAMSAGVRKGLGVIRSAIRQEIDNPRVRKVIASRFKKNKRTGIREAKVGAGVGKHNAGKGGRGRPGVGISKQNAHWYFLGTTARVTTNGAYRGQMPKNNAVPAGYAKSNRKAVVEIGRKIWETIEKEIAKGR